MSDWGYSFRPLPPHGRPSPVSEGVTPFSNRRKGQGDRGQYRTYYLFVNGMKFAGGGGIFA